MAEAETQGSKPLVFDYNGKEYRIAHEGGIVVAREKDRLPESLARVTSPRPLTFDENNILLPQNVESTNNMVSTAYLDEWEKLARMFHFGKEFQVITINKDGLVGPTFLAGNRILIHGEILALVSKEAIKGISTYTWERAESNYDYGESKYKDDYDRDFYCRLVVNRTRGFKPVLISTLPVSGS